MSRLYYFSFGNYFNMDNEFEHDEFEHNEDCDCCSGCDDYDDDFDDEDLQTIMLDIDGESVEFAIVASFEYLDSQFLAVTPIEGEGEAILFLKNEDPEDEDSEWFVVEDEDEITNLYNHIVEMIDPSDFDDDDFSDEDFED